MRDAYWSVADKELRGQIIDLNRESDEASLRYWRAVVADSEDSLLKMERNPPNWGIVALFSVIIFGWIGSHFAGPSGPAVGAVIGLIMGLPYRNTSRLNHSFAIRAAQELVADERKNLSEMEAEAPLFSTYEEVIHEQEPPPPAKAEGQF